MMNVEYTSVYAMSLSHLDMLPVYEEHDVAFILLIVNKFTDLFKININDVRFQSERNLPILLSIVIADLICKVHSNFNWALMFCSCKIILRLIVISTSLNTIFKIFISNNWD